MLFQAYPTVVRNSLVIMSAKIVYTENRDNYQYTKIHNLDSSESSTSHVIGLKFGDDRDLNGS